MSITFNVLGSAGRDNALLVQVDSGQQIERLLFDCGEGCLTDVPFADIQAIDHLFFSHLHADHVGGFDSFFRCTFNRESRPNRIWGPPETSRIMQHRFQGFLWNLHGNMCGTWHVADVGAGEIRTTRFELNEAFAVAHDEGLRSHEATIVDGVGFSVQALTMDHRTPTLAFIVREKARWNIDTTKMASLGLRPGPWLKQLKENPGSTGSVMVGGSERSLAELRALLLVETPGDSIAYLTDFLLDEAVIERLSAHLQGCRTIVCEGQYRHADLELAQRNFHMTTQLSATLAKKSQAGELILFHLSDRYERDDWLDMLAEARRVFPNTRYPTAWKLT